jgi:cation diffusion facilitator family transporter
MKHDYELVVPNNIDSLTDHHSDHHHHHHEHTTSVFSTIRNIVSEYNSLIMIFIALLNLIYSMIEIMTGLYLSSLVLFSDGLHNLSDVLAIFITYYAEKFKKPQEGSFWDNHERFPFGVQRLELIGGLLNSVFLLSTAVFITLEAVPRLILGPELFEGGKALVIVSAIGFTMNLGATLFFGGHHHHGHGHDHHHNNEHHHHCHSEENLNFRAAFLHFLGDAFSSLAVFVAGLIVLVFPAKQYSFVNYMDPVCSLLIVVLLVWTSLPLTLEICLVLLQQNPFSNLEMQNIENKILESFDEIIRVTNLQIWGLSNGKSKATCSCRISIPEDCRMKVPELCHKVEKMLKHEFKMKHVTVQAKIQSVAASDV